MAEPTTPESPTPGRGAQRRRERREERERSEALRWWARPGVLVFLLMLVLAAAGWVLVIQAGQRIPVEEATIGGLQMHYEEARWILDQMDHGENFQKPSTMMPDMPVWGSQRMTLELAFVNRAEEPRVIDASEFMLVPEIGDEVPPMGAQVGRARLEPGQKLNNAIHFDFDTRLPHGALRVAWRRGGEEYFLPIPEPAEHYHLRPRGGEVSLPPDARLVLPLGEAERGKQLYDGVYGCVACHGDPEIPETNNVGPHLATIGDMGADRVEGMSAAQYIYQSILNPGAVIAPICQNGQPCSEPTAMPEYASLVNLQDVADMLVYLMEQRAEDGAAAESSESSESQQSSTSAERTEKEAT